MNRLRFGVPGLLWAVGCTAHLVAGCGSAPTTTPPAQPAEGPGGADYTHESVEALRFGEGNDEYWLFLPDEPMPAEAPFVVFLHGWSGMNPSGAGGWIQHIVRKGRIVVYPRYQADLLTQTSVMVDSALGAIQRAWERLNTEGPVFPVQHRIVWVGHSLGGAIAVKHAAAFMENGLPVPGALMLVQPGAVQRIGIESLDGLPADTIILVVVGDVDTVAGDTGANAIMNMLGYMPPSQVEKVTIRSDHHSTPALVADHLSPLSTIASFPLTPSNVAEDDPAPEGRSNRFPPNALDYFGYWKLCDGLLDAVFRGRNLEYAFGNTEQQRYMGHHSDGVPAVPLVVQVHESEGP